MNRVGVALDGVTALDRSARIGWGVDGMRLLRSMHLARLRAHHIPEDPAESRANGFRGAPLSTLAIPFQLSNSPRLALQMAVIDPS